MLQWVVVMFSLDCYNKRIVQSVSQSKQINVVPYVASESEGHKCVYIAAVVSRYQNKLLSHREHQQCTLKPPNSQKTTKILPAEVATISRRLSKENTSMTTSRMNDMPSLVFLQIYFSCCMLNIAMCVIRVVWALQWLNTIKLKDNTWKHSHSTGYLTVLQLSHICMMMQLYADHLSDMRNDTWSLCLWSRRLFFLEILANEFLDLFSDFSCLLFSWVFFVRYCVQYLTYAQKLKVSQLKSAAWITKN